MPTEAKRPCRKPMCPEYAEKGGLCALHRRDVQKKQDGARGSAASRGYDYRWQQYTKQYRKRHPLCRLCAEADRITATQVVDHIVPHKGDKRLFWDPNNHQPLCKACHDRKTAVEDGGFGNVRRTRK